jgi:threonine synthase
VVTSALTHLECSNCGRQVDAEVLQTVCPVCGKVLLARYDLTKAAISLTREVLSRRVGGGMWRWQELLPVRDPANITALGEGNTPLLPAPRLGAATGLPDLWVKEEGLNPTASFKARGLSAAISRARELGARAIALPSAGNAASAAAAYAARAGLPCWVFMPVDTPATNKVEVLQYGAHLVLVRGLIDDCGRMVRAQAEKRGWFDVSTLKEPYRAEGKKTMGLELAEQSNWTLPDAVLYPTGGGTGIVGMWKAFAELEAMGWIGAKRPKMISIQAAGCAPIVRAHAAGTRSAPRWEHAATVASGLRVPAAIGDYLILDAIRQSGGTALTVTDEEMIAATGQFARLEGIYAAPEGAATVAALRHLTANGMLAPQERVVLFNTGSGLKYQELAPAPDAPVIEPDDPRLDALLDAAAGPLS